MSRSIFLFHISVLLLSIAGLSACGSDYSAPVTDPVDNMPGDSGDPQEPEFSASLFDESSAVIDNPYFPVVPGVRMVYEGVNEDGELERVEVTGSHLTPVVDGVESAISVFREWVVDEDEEELLELAMDWFAQDTEGNVWYLGEEVFNYEDNEFTDQEGSWESGEDVAGTGQNAIAGIQMKAELVLDDSYMQEIYPGEAEDTAVISALDLSVDLDNGDSFSSVLRIEESDPLEPSAFNEYKYYAPGIGLIAEENLDGSERFELVETSDQREPDISPEDFTYPTLINNPYSPMTIGDLREYEVYEEGELIETVSIEILSPEQEGGNKVVNGIPVIVQRDRVRDEDGLLIEDTLDWFAQDDDGNVWYLGEEVTNYEYDDEGNLLGTDSGGSFEWGIDGAQPGIQMLAEVYPGASYRQEYYEGEAEDIAAIISLDEELTLTGVMFSTDSLEVLMTEDWNPLEPEEARERKYYLAGLGPVREEKVDGSEYLEIVERAIVEPDISPADFTTPRVIDNNYHPLPIGDLREYEVYEDGELIETIIVEVLADTDPGGSKIVNGVPVVVQRDRVMNADGQIIEDTYDWFAQDDDGNVWYLGEEVTNYEYDDEGNLLGTDSEGSFEWGIDGALPGIQMLADPQVGDYYRQEFYAGEAEDVAMIVAVDVDITVNDTDYTSIRSLDWNPLDEDAEIEAKYYAPGIGVVREETLDGSEEVILVNHVAP